MIRRFFYEAFMGWLLVFRAVLRKVSRRARDRYLVWQTTQALLPESQRACSICDGYKCSDCDYKGLEVDRQAREHRLMMEEHARIQEMNAQALKKAERALERVDRMLERTTRLSFRSTTHYSYFRTFEDEEDNDQEC